MGAAFLASWPWDNLGFFKYVLYGPVVGKAVASRAWEPSSPDHWLFLLLALFALRAFTYQLWSSYSNMLFLTRRRRIVRDGVDFEQIDNEWDCSGRPACRTCVQGQLPDPADPDGGHGAAVRLPVATASPGLGRQGPGRGGPPARGGHGAPLLRGAQGLPRRPPLLPLPRAAPLHEGAHAIHGRVRHAARAPRAGRAHGAAARGGMRRGCRLRGAGLRVRSGIRLPQGHGPLQRRALPRRNLPGGPVPQIPHLHPDVPHGPPHREGGQLLPVHAAVRPPRWHARRQLLGPADQEQSRCGRGPGLRVPGARGGRDAVHARAIRHADLRIHALRRAGLPPPAMAHLALLHVHGVGMVQDLRHLLLPPPRQAPPDMGRPEIRVPLLPALRQGRHQRPDRARHSQGRKDGRQSRQPRGSQQERGAQRRRHAVREQAPGPAGARRARQHAHGGGDPQRDPRGHRRGVHDGGHLQARQGHRALPLPQEDPRHDDDALQGPLPEDPEGGLARPPAVPRAGHQVPVGGAVQDVDRREVAVAQGAAVGAARHALPPVRGAAHPGIPPGLHIRQARRHAPPQGRQRTRVLRVLARARGRARVSRRRRRALPRRVHAPRGWRHRRRPHRPRMEGRAQARHPARLIARRPCKGQTGPHTQAHFLSSFYSLLDRHSIIHSTQIGYDVWWFITIQFTTLLVF